MGGRAELLDLLEELGAMEGVRGALIATAEGALASGERSGLGATTANDVAKTIRRMTVASATVGVPLRDLLINFGAARMMVTPLTDEATIVVLLERDTAVSPVRALLSVQLTELRRLLHDDDRGRVASPAGVPKTAGRDEIDRVLEGELGPALGQIRQEFSTYVLRAGKTDEEAKNMMREQMQEWLLCCNPSPHTFPLLVDGLGQLLGDAPREREQFMEAVRGTIRDAQATMGKLGPR